MRQTCCCQADESFLIASTNACLRFACRLFWRRIPRLRASTSVQLSSWTFRTSPALAARARL